MNNKQFFSGRKFVTSISEELKVKISRRQLREKNFHSISLLKDI